MTVACVKYFIEGSPREMLIEIRITGIKGCLHFSHYQVIITYSLLCAQLCNHKTTLKEQFPPKSNQKANYVHVIARPLSSSELLHIQEFKENVSWFVNGFQMSCFSVYHYMS